MDTLDLRSIATLQRTCKTLRTLLSGLISRRIRSGVQAFFPKPGALALVAQTLRDSGAIISGSTALRALVAPPAWKTGDLDIIVDAKRADVVSKFLVQEGYRYDAAITAQAHADRYPLAWRYVALHNILTGRKIDLCIVPVSERNHYILSQTEEATGGHEDHGVLKQMLNYHSSVVMNFFDGWRFVSVFPGWTCEGVNLRNDYIPTTDRLELALRKYEGRGFRMNKVLRGPHPPPGPQPPHPPLDPAGVLFGITMDENGELITIINGEVVQPGPNGTPPANPFGLQLPLEGINIGPAHAPPVVPAPVAPTAPGDPDEPAEPAEPTHGPAELVLESIQYMLEHHDSTSSSAISLPTPADAEADADHATLDVDAIEASIAMEVDPADPETAEDNIIHQSVDGQLDAADLKRFMWGIDYSLVEPEEGVWVP